MRVCKDVFKHDSLQLLNACTKTPECRFEYVQYHECFTNCVDNLDVVSGCFVLPF